MKNLIRIGLLRLCDAAPVILAKHDRLFAAAGLNVALSVEPSWANIADKLAYNMLDGAVMLPPLALACAAGLRGRPVGLVVPMSLSSEGNSLTLSTACQNAFSQGGIKGLAARKRLRLAVVHGYSSHDLLLRYWLAAQGVQPDKDMDITILPPAEMVGSLAAGAIDGFCVGAPWGMVAAKAGIGFTACLSRDIWPGHPEKCLALQEEFATASPDLLNTLLTVLLHAQRESAAPQSRARLAALLARPEYLDLPAELLTEALDETKGGPSFTAPYPSIAQAEWYALQLQRWSKAPAGLEKLVPQIYRPDLFLRAGGEAETEAALPE